MPSERSAGKPTTRRYSDAEKDQAVRLVRKLRAELGTEQGTVQRVAEQLGYGVESVRRRPALSLGMARDTSRRSHSSRARPDRVDRAGLGILEAP